VTSLVTCHWCGRQHVAQILLGDGQFTTLPGQRCHHCGSSLPLVYQVQVRSAVWGNFSADRRGAGPALATSPAKSPSPGSGGNGGGVAVQSAASGYRTTTTTAYESLLFRRGVA
jgi:hypothetical protein